MLRHIRLLAILIEMVCLYAWASGATAKFAGMPRKLKFYQKKSAERLKKLRKLIVDNYVMPNADSSPSRRRFLSLYTDIISMSQPTYSCALSSSITQLSVIIFYLYKNIHNKIMFPYNKSIFLQMGPQPKLPCIGMHSLVLGIPA